jgi:hypothetical protein
MAIDAGKEQAKNASAVGIMSDRKPYKKNIPSQMDGG